MKEEIRENDIVTKTNVGGTKCTARVRWVNDKGQVGVTYLAPDNYAGSAQVVDVEELELVERGSGEKLKTASIAELKAAIARLRPMRLPKKRAARKASARRTPKTKLDVLFEEGGVALDNLIQKAVTEIREEEEGGKVR